MAAILSPAYLYHGGTSHLKTDQPTPSSPMSIRFVLILSFYVNLGKQNYPSAICWKFP